MVLYALDDIDDAIDVTRGLLTPVDRTVWVKLAVVAFFIGGPGAGFNGFQYTFGGNGGTGGPPPGGVVTPDLGFPVWALIAAIVGVVLLIALAFALVGSIMEFVFVESLRSEEVTIRRYWGRRWRQGVRLFGFRVLIGFVVLGTAALTAGFGVLFVALTVTLLPLYFVPSRVATSPQDALPGAITTAIGWTVLHAAIQFFVANASQYAIYGVLSGLILILTSTYVAAVVLMLGVVVNAVLATETDELYDVSG